MTQELPTIISGETDLSVCSREQLIARVQDLTTTVQSLRHRVAWFERQIFGVKSERLKLLENPQQLLLGEVLAPPSQAPAVKERTVAAHTRRSSKKDVAVGDAESVPFFDETNIPVETIELVDPEVEKLSPDQFEVIGEKSFYRLAQRPGSHVVLKYVSKVVKCIDTQKISAASAPVGVIEGSRADVSFIVGMLIDKFSYYLPLYRQHQRLTDCGIRVSRSWLTQLSQQAIRLLEPIYEAQFDSIRTSRVKAMDETSIKAGRSEGGGKMKTAYFWPVYGDQNEVCFPYFPSREAKCIYTALGVSHAPESVLLTDGYAAYASYANKVGIAHAQCWAHARREFFEAHDSNPDGVTEALKRISAIYSIEEEIRKDQLAGESKRLHRLTHSKPHVEVFFDWVDRQFQEHGLRPATAFTKALNYVRERRLGLELFMTDPDVPIDTNHLERALRAIPMGRKNWNFCWTELGAKHVGIMQSIIVTCRLHHVDPYTYLVDVLQRVGQHPASQIAELTPRLWKQHFASAPLRSDLHTRVT